MAKGWRNEGQGVRGQGSRVSKSQSLGSVGRGGPGVSGRCGRGSGISR